MAKLGDKDMTLEEKQALLKREAVIHAESLYHYKLIARAIGKTEETLKEWRDSDDDFSGQLEEARIKFLKKHIKQARPEFLLERMEPEVFKERKEWEGNLSGDVTFVNSVPRPKSE